jgi:hypothetical protein
MRVNIKQWVRPDHLADRLHQLLAAAAAAATAGAGSMEEQMPAQSSSVGCVGEGRVAAAAAAATEGALPQQHEVHRSS